MDLYSGNEQSSDGISYTYPTERSGSVSSSGVHWYGLSSAGEELLLMKVRGWSSDKKTLSSKAELGYER